MKIVMEVLIYCFYGRKNDILTIWQNREVIYILIRYMKF